MKKTLFCLIIFIVSHTGFAQNATWNEPNILTYKDPLNQSAKKKKTGIILLSSGTAVAATGLAFMISGLADGGSFEAINDDDFESNDARFMAGFIASQLGIGLALTSIPFFRKSRELRNAALQLKTSSNNFYTVAGKLKSVSQMQVGIIFPLNK